MKCGSFIFSFEIFQNGSRWEFIISGYYVVTVCALRMNWPKCPRKMVYWQVGDRMRNELCFRFGGRGGRRWGLPSLCVVSQSSSWFGRGASDESSLVVACAAVASDSFHFPQIFPFYFNLFSINNRSKLGNIINLRLFYSCNFERSK